MDCKENKKIHYFGVNYDIMEAKTGKKQFPAVFTRVMGFLL